MTGFGSSEKRGFRVEVRSLNHRFLEINLRLPPGLSRHDIVLRDAIKDRFDRGKFDVYVATTDGGKLSLDLNEEQAAEVLSALRKLSGSLGLPGEVDMATLLNWKEFFLSEEVSFDEAALHEAFHEALEELEAMRVQEGKVLEDDLMARAGSLDALAGRVAELMPAAAEAAKLKYHERLKELLAEKDCEDGRLLQEASSIAERADIAEELTRLRGHVQHMRQMLTGGGTVGRKLDFLFQELNREANTVGSKASEAEITNLVIELKNEIERGREQAQNVQ